MREFEGRTAVITGGASGMGLATARRLGREGMRIVLLDIEDGALATAVEEFEAADVPVLGHRTDVADIESVRSAAVATADRFGDVHVLFNNAGVGGGGPMLEPDDLEVWDWTLGVNLMGVIHGIKVFGSAMAGHGEPCHIVNTASMAGLLPTPGLGSYTVSKYAVVAMSETLSLETVGTNLGVSVLCPGFVQTKIADADRNLPEHLVSLEEPTAEREFMRQMMRDLVAGGLPPEQVADEIFEAIRDDRFYILPHPQYVDLIRLRAVWIAKGTAPQTWEF
jgi:NAD(P)-dependent dehydrogenase (short-subunit alcohol dehydrogenase family)